MREPTDGSTKGLDFSLPWELLGDFFFCSSPIGCTRLILRTKATRQFVDEEVFFRDASFAEIPNVLGVFKFLGLYGRPLAFLTEGRFSECCFRPTEADPKLPDLRVNSGATVKIAAQ